MAGREWNRQQSSVGDRIVGDRRDHRRRLLHVTAGAPACKWSSDHKMAKDMITVDGEEIVVCEDTAKAYRFVRRARSPAAIGLGIMAIVFTGLRSTTKNDGKLEPPTAPPPNANSQ